MKVAIYSRKSVFTGKGESIENQIQLCKDYILRSYNIDNVEFLIYEDEGFSGGNMNRPKFQQLLNDVKTKKFNALICYRLDRISRNVADFSSTLDLLQKNEIDFISIKEQFDTSTPMGRAMVYIASVFAQLERETISERVRDNMLQLSKSGRWLGGQPPLGFKSEKILYIDENLKEKSLMKLSPVKEQLDIVNIIYNKYLELHSVRSVEKYLAISNIKGKNGGNLHTGSIARILKNPIYVQSSYLVEDYFKEVGINTYGSANGNGYLIYNKTKGSNIDRAIEEWIVAISNHKGLIKDSDWVKVQKMLKANTNKEFSRAGTGSVNKSLFSSLLKCSKCGANMKVVFGHKSKSNPDIRDEYYTCANRRNALLKENKCTNPNIRVDTLDRVLLEQIKAYNKNILVESLEERLSTYSNSDDNEAKKRLADELKSKELASSNLVKKLSLSPNENVTTIIMNEINILANDISSLKTKLNEFTTTDTNINAALKTIDSTISTLNSFKNNFDFIDDIEQKRLMIRSLVDTIYWDGDKYQAKINLFGSDYKKK